MAAPLKTWQDHVITSIGGLKSRTVGGLDPWEVRKLKPWAEKLGNMDEIPEPLRMDFWAIRFAIIELDRKEEEQPPPGPLQTDELRFDKEEERPSEKEPLSADPLRTDSFCAQPEPSETLVRVKADLIDPAFRKRAERFLAECDTARQRLRDSETPWEAAQVGGIGTMLEALAIAAGLGKEFEMVGKGLRFEAYYRAAQLRKPQPAGRPENGSSPPEPFTKHEKELMNALARLAEEDFDAILASGIAKGNLSEKLFKERKPAKQPKVSAIPIPKMDPMRHFLNFAADFRTQPDYYTPDQVKRFIADERVMESFGPICEQYVAFSIALVGAVRAKLMLGKK